MKRALAILAVLCSCGVGGEVGEYPHDALSKGDGRSGGDSGSPGNSLIDPNAPVEYSDTAAATAARIIASALCDRRWDDCSFYCGPDECGNSHSDCVDRYVVSRVGSLSYPVGSTTLATRCADAVKTGSCMSFEDPLTLSDNCRHAVLNGCGVDNDGYGMPYFWEAAASLEPLPADVSITVCHEVHEWYQLELRVGDSVGLALDSTTGDPISDPVVNVSLHEPIDTVDGTTVQNVDWDLLDSSSITYLEGAPSTGTYFLELDLMPDPWSPAAAETLPLRIFITDNSCQPLLSCTNAVDFPGQACGTIPDGCGGTLDCPDCFFSGDVCGSSQRPHVCLKPCSEGCWPDECLSDGYCE